METSIKPAGYTDPEFGRAIAEYMSRFDCAIEIRLNSVIRTQFYQWCADHLGNKYSDWFVRESGTLSEKRWTIYIRSAHRATFFRLRWADAILDSVDVN